jgi:iron-sulfur cluster repair protein YtfE (RIC family)
MKTSSAVATIDPQSTVNDVIKQYPATIAIFNSFGIDSCCGGAKQLVEVAERHGIGLDVLRAALESAIGPRKASA